MKRSLAFEAELQHRIRLAAHDFATAIGLLQSAPAEDAPEGHYERCIAHALETLKTGYERLHSNRVESALELGDVVAARMPDQPPRVGKVTEVRYYLDGSFTITYNANPKEVNEPGAKSEPVGGLSGPADHREALARIEAPGSLTADGTRLPECAILCDRAICREHGSCAHLLPL